MSRLARVVQDSAAPAPPGLSSADVTALRDAKWMVIESALLDGEHVAVVFEKRWLKEARRDLPGTVLYFPPEIAELRRFQDDPDAIKAIHRVKKNFGAWIVPFRRSGTPQIRAR